METRVAAALAIAAALGGIALWRAQGATKGRSAPTTEVIETESQDRTARVGVAPSRPPEAAPSGVPRGTEVALALQDAIDQRIAAVKAQAQAEEPHDPNVPNAGPDLLEPPPDGQLGLNQKYLEPVPRGARPPASELASLDAEAERVRRASPKPPPPDPDLLVGMLAAISQVTQNPALRHALMNSYLDQVMGLGEREAAEARTKLATTLREAPER